MVSILAGRPRVEPGVHWGRVAKLLAMHGFTGLAVATHRRRPFLPPDVARAFEAPYLQTALHTTLTRDAARRARAVLSDAGIPSLLYKGAALVEAGVYDDPGAREMGDADLLIRAARASDAVERLRGAGFEPWTPWTDQTSDWLDSATFTDSAAPEGTQVTVDLHWRLGYGGLRFGRSTTDDYLWEGADRDRGLPAPEPHLVALLEHVLKHLHAYAHLTGMADVARLAVRVEDWSEVDRLLARRPAPRGLGALLGVARLQLDAPIPLIGDRLPGTDGRFLARRILDLRSAARRDPRERFPALGLLRRWTVMGSPRAAWREVRRVVVPELPWLRARYQDAEGSTMGLFGRYWRDVCRWMVGRGPSPVSPNQEFGL